MIFFVESSGQPLILLRAGKQISLISGRDTALKGAQVSADKITATVGRDLTLQSLQDTDNYKSKQMAA